jgi:hypothetical protein
MYKSGLATEQQRVEFHIALACVMPPRESQVNKNGWIKPICDRLDLKRGKRSEKNGARPYPSEQTLETRAIFNKDRELLAQPVKVGDMVVSKGQLYRPQVDSRHGYQEVLSVDTFCGQKVLSVDNDNEFRSRCE